ncbi:MAG: hypothetical protein GY832_22475 [Chloroflexi bacterium]|nr:hypothetical protein [Chloroflexota bacterium]
MAFADSSDLSTRFDARTIKDLASDTGEPAGSVDNDIVTAALEDGAGRIRSAATVARIYSDDDLDALTGDSLSLIKRLNCELAMAYLMGRRPEKYGDEDGGFKQVKQDVDDFLDRLRKGERLFGVEANLNAGLPTIDGPSAVTYDRLNLIPDRTQNFYPHRGTRLPLGRGG